MTQLIHSFINKIQHSGGTADVVKVRVQKIESLEVQYIKILRESVKAKDITIKV